MMKTCLLSFFTLSILGISCNSEETKSVEGPIVFGDSSSIVTENDPQYLSNNIPEYAINTPLPEVKKDSVLQKDTVTVAATTDKKTAVAAVAVAGLEIPFKEAKIFIPGISVTQKIEPISSSSASYTLKTGDLSNKVISATQGKILEISQQYQAVAVLDYKGKLLPLKEATSYTSSWEKLSQNNTGNLDATGIRSNKLSASQLKNAITKALKNEKVSSKEIAATLRQLGSNPSIGTGAVRNKLQVVKWRISGQGSNNKSFRYLVRIDVP